MIKLTGLFSRALCIRAGVMPKGKFFYAVRKGFKPGVYNTWDECKTQVMKFPSASYKKFASEADAWAFVNCEPAASENHACQLAPPRVESTPAFPLIPLGRKRPVEDAREEVTAKRVKCNEDACESRDGFTYMGDAVVVYTDGCCSCNGKKRARAGIGVYWGPSHPLNLAERLQGRQTNQRAEIQAACRALEQAKEMNIKKLVLYTDSKFTINGVTIWIKNWKANGWRLKTGGPIINKDDFERLDKLNAELDVVWLHIPGHAGYKGNEEADRLSREGAAK